MTCYIPCAAGVKRKPPVTGRFEPPARWVFGIQGTADYVQPSSRHNPCMCRGDHTVRKHVTSHDRGTHSIARLRFHLVLVSRAPLPLAALPPLVALPKTA